MSHTVRFFPEVEEDALAGYDWYEGKARGLGDEFLRAFYASFPAIARNPMLCAEAGHGFREVVEETAKEKGILARVTAVRHIEDYRLELTFSTGERGEIDFRSRVVGRRGLLKRLEDPVFFQQVRVDPESGTLVWPNGVDFCPDVLYSEATCAPLPSLEHAR